MFWSFYQHYACKVTCTIERNKVTIIILCMWLFGLIVQSGVTFDTFDHMSIQKILKPSQDAQTYKQKPAKKFAPFSIFQDYCLKCNQHLFNFDYSCLVFNYIYFNILIIYNIKYIYVCVCVHWNWASRFCDQRFLLITIFFVC